MPKTHELIFNFITFIECSLFISLIFAKNSDKMIQRIQTVYFLIAAFLLGSLFFVPFAEIVGQSGEIYRIDSGGFYSEGVNIPEFLFRSLHIVLLISISIVFLLLTIFQFKHRSKQMLLSKLIIFILLLLTVLIGFDLSRCINMVQGNYSLKIYLAFPLIAIILVYIGIKAIKKDEKLLKSSNRIR